MTTVGRLAERPLSKLRKTGSGYSGHSSGGVDRRKRTFIDPDRTTGIGSYPDPPLPKKNPG